ncbi:MAG: hypothetical protein SGI88_20915 [Candidatus Hydrogenedentes bacterium]|nr:hypothetical protein [Candidatus Hydrogenedentota bacterium]
MRFGRQNRKLGSWGRLSLRVLERSGDDDAPPGSDSLGQMDSLPPTLPTTDNLAEDPAMTSDPTQRLLTSLGRFHRQFLKAQNGAPQEHWSDECMNYLIQSVEIAVEQRWQDLVEALTETGRILQTYENAGRANECVSFLADSYEILCIMVGDLIVDKVRSGVIRKWRERYQAALEDMERRGLSLVSDDDERVIARAEAAAAQRGPSLRVLRAEPVLTDEDADEIDFSTGDSPSVDADAAPDFGLVSADDETEDEVEVLPAFDDEDLDTLAYSVMDPVLEMPRGEPSALTNLAPNVPPARVLDVAEVLDRLCDCLVRIEQEDDSTLEPVFTNMGKGIAELATRATTNGWLGSEIACNAMQRICAHIEQNPSARDDRFFELAYAFGGVYGDAMHRTDDAILQNWLAESEDYLAFWNVRGPSLSVAAPLSVKQPVVEIPFEIPVAESEPALDFDDDVPSLDDAWGAESVEDELTDAESIAAAATDGDPYESDDPASHLLETARKAVKFGSIGDAKLLAMQAAASIARAQASEADARVRLTETRIQDGVRAIEDARATVQRSESAVAESESGVSEHRAALLDRGRHTQAMQSSMDGIESRISEIERRIREFEQQRDEAQRQRGAATEALDEARAQEVSAKDVLDEALTAEQGARIRLEDARQNVKMLQRKQAENESGMERARESLNRQRASVSDIEHTIEQIRSAEGANGAGGDELLF